MTLGYSHTIKFHCRDWTASSTNWILLAKPETGTIKVRMDSTPGLYWQQHVSPSFGTITSSLHSVDCKEQLSLNTLDCQERIRNRLSTDCPHHECQVGCKGQKLANPFSMILCYHHTINFHCQDRTASSMTWILREKPERRTVNAWMD